jgi:hypothetical protein
MIPVTKLLTKTGISIDEVDQVELVGGGIRVPKI